MRVHATSLRHLRLIFLPVLAGLASAGGQATAGPTATVGPLRLVATFESIGAYLPVAGSLDDLRAEMAYRAAGEADWHPALPPVACAPQHEFRGSALLLDPSTSYEVKVRLWRGNVAAGESEATVRTWSDEVPVAREVVLPAGTSSQPLIIIASGRPDGWIRYRAAREGSTIDVGTAAPSPVVLDHAAYVVIEGLTIRGGTSHAVHVVDSHDVRVQDCEMAGWGEPGAWRFYRDKKRQQWAYVDEAGRILDRQAGVRVRGGGSTRVVIERNLIHHPRGTAACWAFAHPHGPSGIVLSETGGNNVVRDNDLISGDGHRWNDAIESEYNGEPIGGPYRDTDISGNLLVGANDDGTELDGGQMNVRYWHNWIGGGLCGISCAPNLLGPSYVFCNVAVTGDERGASGAGFKMGGDPGVTFLLNNTIYTSGFGLTSGHYGKNPSAIFSRNNLFAGPLPGQGRLRLDHSVTGDLDHDLIPPDGVVGQREFHRPEEAGAIFARPEFADPATRDFRLVPRSPGTGLGVSVASVATAGADLGAIPGTIWALADWPRRPGAPEIFPQRTIIRLRTGERATATWRVQAPAGTRWRAIVGESWLTGALSGESDGTPQVLVCHLDGRTLAPGTHSTFVAVRTAKGGLRSVPLVAEVEPWTTVICRFEAEAGEGGGGFEKVRATDASNNGYVRATTSHGSPLAFTFTLNEPDRFYILARVRATGPVAQLSRQDSLTFRIDDGPEMTWDLFGIGVGEWTWVRAVPKENVAGAFVLAAGRHRLQIGAREPLVELDEIVASNSPFLSKK